MKDFINTLKLSLLLFCQEKKNGEQKGINGLKIIQLLYF